MNNNLFKRLKEILKKDQRLMAGNTLLRNKIIELTYKEDEDLIQLLLSDNDIKDYFFSIVNNIIIFDKENFVKFVNNKSFLPDSYTSFKNKIGLFEDGEYIEKKKEISLAWPYKDCVLEGDQTDPNEKRSEIFWSEILAPEEIDRLIEPKVFTNFRRITQNGINEEPSLKEDDNLVIKGNNFLVLHSLKKIFTSKIDLIYIDPPFNVGSDEFKYNDKFSRSTWLTFMKNRLEISKELLSNKGAILVHIDHHQSHYLKVLMDEIFGENNFRNEIIWSYRTGGIPKQGMLPRKHDTIYLYSKSDSFSFELLKERQYLQKKFMGSEVDEEGRHYVDTNIRDVIEGVINIVDEDKEHIDEVNARPVLNLSNENVEDFRSQKPEGLIYLLLKLFTNKGDLILDYCAGTGTTLSVAHKMDRRYIGVEQMDYINTKLVPRLEEVIEGDENGISGNVDWTGGGDFLYTELMELNQRLINKIEKSNNKEELINLWNDIKKEGFLSYKLDPQNFEENIEDFKELNYENQKEFLLECLDKNHLYVNLSEIEDEDYNINQIDKELNKKFYEGDL